MKLRDLNEVYKGWNNHKLLQIIQHPEDYHTEAVIAATKELERRNIPIEEIEIISETRKESLSHLNEDTQSKVLDIYQKFNSETSEINPFYQIFTLKGKTTDKQILYISLYFVYQGCFTFIDSFQLLFNSSLLIFSSTLAITYLYCSFLLWERKKWGWIISNLILCTHLFLYTINIFFQLFGIEDYSKSVFILLKHQNIVVLFHAILTSIACWALSQKSIREIFSIRTSQVVLIWGLFAFSIYFFFNYFIFN